MIFYQQLHPDTNWDGMGADIFFIYGPTGIQYIITIMILGC
jgi:hypothetical protein